MPRAISNPPIGCDPPTQTDPSDEASRQAMYGIGVEEPTTVEPALAGNRLIRELLAALLDRAPRAAMVCLSTLGADERESSGTRAFYRVIRARPGEQSENLVGGVPAVPDWRGLLPSLGAGQGIVLRVADLRPGPLPIRLSPTGAAYVLACPANGPTGDPAGAVFVIFDIGDRAPRGAELRRVRGEGARIGSQIAAVLDLVRQGRSPSPHAEAA
jgi:hypothetical protein